MTLTSMTKITTVVFAKTHGQTANLEKNGCPVIREAMPKNRLMALKQFLHFNDNSKTPENCSDKCYKLRPLITCFTKTLCSLATFTVITLLMKNCWQFWTTPNKTIH